MRGMQEKKIQVAIVVLAVVLIGGVAVLLTRRAGEVNPPESITDTDATLPRSFTFFGLDANDPLTPAVRRRLSAHLGSDAIEKRGLIDLTLNPPGLVEERFDTLWALHRSLNSEVGARVEHNITRLTYRYPAQKDTPFALVRLVFSNYNAKPLYFQMTLKKEGSAIIDTVKEKYGAPDPIAYPGNTGPVLYWEKSGDMLIVSQLRDRFGDPEYHVMICYVNNLRQLRTREQKEIEIREQELKKAGKTAF